MAFDAPLRGEELMETPHALHIWIALTASITAPLRTTLSAMIKVPRRESFSAHGSSRDSFPCPRQ